MLERPFSSIVQIAPIADMRVVDHYPAMRTQSLVPMALASCLLSSCGAPPGPELPQLLRGATAGGGTTLLCEQAGGPGSTPETAAHSPELFRRLRRDFPPGTSAAELRQSLVRQGFSIHDACSPDRTISWAEFRRRGGNGITSMAAFGTVYWREDAAGRLVWTTGNIAFTGL